MRPRCRDGDFFQRRAVGELLWADANGLVVAQEDTLILYDTAAVERVSAPIGIPDGLVMSAQFVRPVLAGGGLFVLADTGLPLDPDNADNALLLYVVR